MARRTHIEAAMNNALTKSTLFAIILAGGIYFLTPPLAMSFYELYHLVKIEFIYTIYTAIKFISAYFMLWEWRGVTSIAIGSIGGLIMYWRKAKASV
jgi:hypothetical protein